jgi:tRNA pseudouridine38-40 synthase
VHVEVRKVLQRILNLQEPPVLHCSGRTDAGVHARFQVAHFITDTQLGIEKLRGGMGKLLPRDIALLSLNEMPADFHARRKATSKTYLYRILNRRQSAALDRERVLHIVPRLDVDAMREAAQHLVGKHDFASFEGRLSAIITTVRTMFSATVDPVGDEIHFRITGDGFLKYMVRNIVGTLVEIGLGKRSAASMLDIRTKVDRAAAGMTAPPHGLYLERVRYPEPYESILREGFVFMGERNELVKSLER